MSQQPADQPGLVILAGGENSRLRPLAATIYKGFLPVNGASMVARNLTAAAIQGLAGGLVVTDHHEPTFGAGWTAGGFRARELLVGGSPAEKILAAASVEPNWRPLLVCMGDTRARVEFARLAQAPALHDVDSALCVSRYRIPYGVIQVETEQIVEFLEKPATEYLVNTGYMALGLVALELLRATRDVASTLQTLARDRRLACAQLVDAFTAIDTFEDLAAAHSRLDEA